MAREGNGLSLEEEECEQRGRGPRNLDKLLTDFFSFQRLFSRAERRLRLLARRFLLSFFTHPSLRPQRRETDSWLSLPLALSRREEEQEQDR